MPDVIVSQLETPEVNLYYTLRGSGPILLILQGGAGNAEGSEALADQLAGQFTVVTYDRRGLSRSTPVRAEGHEIAIHANDAARLLAALSPAPAFVFGSSMGALIGLELAAEHSTLVRLLIAHEPPVYRLLERITQFVQKRPAYLSLLAAPIRFRRDPAARKASRIAIANAFQAKNPSLSKEQSLLAANVSLQIVRGMMTLYGEADPKGKALVVAEFKKVLTWYLGSMLSGDAVRAK